MWAGICGSVCMYPCVYMYECLDVCILCIKITYIHVCMRSIIIYNMHVYIHSCIHTYTCIRTEIHILKLATNLVSWEGAVDVSAALDSIQS